LNALKLAYLSISKQTSNAHKTLQMDDHGHNIALGMTWPHYFPTFFKDHLKIKSNLNLQVINLVLSNKTEERQS